MRNFGGTLRGGSSGSLVLVVLGSGELAVKAVGSGCPDWLDRCLDLDFAGLLERPAMGGEVQSPSATSAGP
jgi:hypothetical protein